jgi:hypothetical protein
VRALHVLRECEELVVFQQYMQSPDIQTITYTIVLEALRGLFLCGQCTSSFMRQSIDNVVYELITLNIQNFRVILSFTDISTLVLVFYL